MALQIKRWIGWNRIATYIYSLACLEVAIGLSQANAGLVVVSYIVAPHPGTVRCDYSYSTRSEDSFDLSSFASSNPVSFLSSFTYFTSVFYSEKCHDTF